MAELDYAYLADYAQVENGKLWAVGASYTHALVPVLPTGWLTSVAGRIRLRVGESAPEVGMTLTGPSGAPHATWTGVMHPDKEMRPYRGYVGVLFAITLQLFVVEVGLYTAEITVNGKVARRLSFDVEVREPE